MTFQEVIDQCTAGHASELPARLAFTRGGETRAYRECMRLLRAEGYSIKEATEGRGRDRRTTVIAVNETRRYTPAATAAQPVINTSGPYMIGETGASLASPGPNTTAPSTPPPTIDQLIRALNGPGAGLPPIQRPISEWANQQLGRPFNNNEASQPPAGPPQPGISEVLRLLERNQSPLLPPRLRFSIDLWEVSLIESEQRHPFRRAFDGLRAAGYQVRQWRDEAHRSQVIEFTKDRRQHQRDLDAYYGYNPTTRESRPRSWAEYAEERYGLTDADRLRESQVRSMIENFGAVSTAAAQSGRSLGDVAATIRNLPGLLQPPTPTAPAAPPAPKTLAYPVHNKRKITA